jgi:hypothetical protein
MEEVRYIILEKILVVVNPELETEEIYYCGCVEFEALKIFKKLPFKFKQVVKAKVKMVKLYGEQLIQSYEVIEKIR